MNYLFIKPYGTFLKFVGNNCKCLESLAYKKYVQSVIRVYKKTTHIVQTNRENTIVRTEISEHRFFVYIL